MRTVLGMLVLLGALLLPAIAHTIEHQVVSIGGRDLVFRSADGLLYVGVPTGYAGPEGSVTAIDPNTGQIQFGIQVASNPERLALADDGRTLYVALSNGWIQVVDLETRAITSTFNLGSDPVEGPYRAEDMAVQPGNPGVLAVSLRFNNEFRSPRHAGVAIFDHGVARPLRTDTHTGSNTIVFSTSDPTRLYGADLETSSSDFFRLQVTSDGVAEIDHTSGLLDDRTRLLLFRDGLIHTERGQILDPEPPQLTSGFSLPIGDPGMAVALDATRAYFMTQGGELFEFDRATRALISNQPLPPALTIARRLVRWGADGLAYVVTGDEDGLLVILRRIHEAPICDLDVSLRDGRDPSTQGELLDYLVRVRNLGPNTAGDVVLRDRLPVGSVLRYLTQGGIFVDPVDSSGVVVRQLGTIAPGDSVEVHIGVEPTALGLIQNVAEVATSTSDSNASNNQAAEQTEIREPGWDRVDLWVRFVPPAADLEVGQEFKYAVLVGNRGPAGAARSFLYHQAYVPYLQHVSVFTPVGTCEMGSGTVNCIFPAIAAGDSVAVEITAIVSQAAEGDLMAQVRADTQIDRDPTNDDASWRVAVAAPDVLALLAALVAQVRGYDLQRGIRQGLVRELGQASEAWRAGDQAAACEAMADFRGRVDRIAARRLTPEQVQALRAAAAAVEQAIGCVVALRSDGTLAASGPVARLGFESRSALADPIKRFELTLPASRFVRVDVIDLAGRSIRRLSESELGAGVHRLSWDGRGEDGARSRPGVYFLRVLAGADRLVARALVLR